MSPLAGYLVVNGNTVDEHERMTSSDVAEPGDGRSIGGGG